MLISEEIVLPFLSFAFGVPISIYSIFLFFFLFLCPLLLPFFLIERARVCFRVQPPLSAPQGDLIDKGERGDGEPVQGDDLRRSEERGEAEESAGRDHEEMRKRDGGECEASGNHRPHAAGEVSESHFWNFDLKPSSDHSLTFDNLILFRLGPEGQASMLCGSG